MAGQKKTAAKKTVRKKTAAKKTGARKTAAKKTVRKSAARKKAAPRKTAAKKKAAKPAPNISADYAAARKALATLWDDVSAEAHTRFSSVSKRVEKQFNDARKNIKDVDVKYALEKSKTKANKLIKSTSKWVREVGLQSKLLYQMLRDSVNKKFKAPWATISTITATLLYVVSPIDIIPDFFPGIGLIDDALMIALCISIIRRDLKRYAEENNLDLADYGLA